MERHPLHDKYPELHKSSDVQKATERAAELEQHKPASQPAEKLETWMQTLEKIHFGRDPKVAERIKDIYHKQHVMRPDQVPESYFELQRRIAREQGHGEVNIPDQVRSEMAATITRDQERSLDSWIDYLSSADATYPMWFKYYTFRNIVKLADFDKEKGEFPKRSRSTTTIFPDINREALAYMADSLVAHYGIRDQSPAGTPSQLDPDTKELLDKDANFATLYKHAIEKSQPAHAENLDVTDGQWTRYDQGSSGAALAATLQGYGTGWCTAGEGTAQAQLNMGDFYVYYSKNSDGEYKVPRVAIRMSQGEVAEVRGIGPGQNLEGDLAEITEAKLEDLPGAEAYKQKAEDMRKLTQIERQLHDDPEASLSDDDLRFLNELDHEIKGFGYKRDPRIDEIIEARIGRDTERLKPILLESILYQADNAYLAANIIIERLNSARGNTEQIPVITPERFASALAAKWIEWQKNGTFDYVTDKFERYNTRFTIIATPNILADTEQIMALAMEFGRSQQRDVYAHESLYPLYSAEELSGSIAPDTLVRLSLIPSEPATELGFNTAERQRDILVELQEAQPNLVVPSVLDAMVYWQTLHAEMGPVKGESITRKTYIRHFDLKPRHTPAFLLVPQSYIRRDGVLCLGGDDPTNRYEPYGGGRVTYKRGASGNGRVALG